MVKVALVSPKGAWLVSNPNWVGRSSMASIFWAKVSTMATKPRGWAATINNFFFQFEFKKTANVTVVVIVWNVLKTEENLDHSSP